MSALTKILTVVNLVFSVAITVFVLAYFSNAKSYSALYKAEKDKGSELQVKLDASETAHKQAVGLLEAQNDFLGKALTEAENRLDNKRVELDGMSARCKSEEVQAKQYLAQMERMRQDLLAARSESKDYLAKADAVRDRFAELSDQERRAVEAAAELQAQNESLQRSLAELDRSSAKREDELKQKDLILARLRDQGVSVADTSVPPIRGTVMAVDPESGVVVLNVGKSSSVQVGYEFTVVRGDRYVGRVRVREVDPGWCGATLVEKMQKDKIKVGDQAVTVLD